MIPLHTYGGHSVRLSWSGVQRGGLADDVRVFDVDVDRIHVCREGKETA